MFMLGQAEWNGGCMSISLAKTLVLCFSDAVVQQNAKQRTNGLARLYGVLLPSQFTWIARRLRRGKENNR